MFILDQSLIRCGVSGYLTSRQTRIRLNPVAKSIVSGKCLRQPAPTFTAKARIGFQCYSFITCRLQRKQTGEKTDRSGSQQAGAEPYRLRSFPNLRITVSPWLKMVIFFFRQSPVEESSVFTETVGCSCPADASGSGDVRTVSGPGDSATG